MFIVHATALIILYRLIQSKVLTVFVGLFFVGLFVAFFFQWTENEKDIMNLIVNLIMKNEDNDMRGLGNETAYAFGDKDLFTLNV